MHIESREGLVVYYTDQCSVTGYYVHQELKEIEQKYNIPVQHHKISNREAAQTAPCAFTTYSAFYNGQFITHEIIRFN